MAGIIGYSLQELAEIARYLQEKEDANNPTTVLIGGWAVDSYITLWERLYPDNWWKRIAIRCLDKLVEPKDKDDQDPISEDIEDLNEKLRKLLDM
jgi:hypothetical protein